MLSKNQSLNFFAFKVYFIFYRKLLGAVEEILEDKERDVGSNYVYLASALSRIHYKTSKSNMFP